MGSSKLERPEMVGEETLVEHFGKRAIIRKFKHPDGSVKDFFLFGGKISVIIFALTEQKEVIAVRQFRYGANDFVLEIPGGNLDGKELEETVREELLEETGYRPEEIIPLAGPAGPVWVDPASLQVPFLPCLAIGCQKIAEPKPEETEIIEIILVPIQEWQEKVGRGEVPDSKTIAVTHLALYRLSQMSLMK